MKSVFDLNLNDLLFFVKFSGHENLHDVMNEVKDLSAYLLKKENEHHLQNIPSDLIQFIKELIESVEDHTSREETKLYPMIEEKLKEASFYPFHELFEEHDDMRSKLEKLKGFLDEVQLETSTPIAQLFESKLQELDRILSNHIQIQDQVLFPKLIKGSPLHP